MSSPPAHENVAALLRRQQSTTARLRAGLPSLLDALEQLEEPAFDVRARDADDRGTGTDPGGDDQIGAK